MRTAYQKEREKLAAKLESDLKRKVQGLRADLYRETLAYLSQRLKQDGQGRISFSVSNIRTANGVSAVVRRFIETKGRRVLAWLIRRLSELFRVNTYYFRAFTVYPESRDEVALRLIMLRIGYDTKAGKVVPGGYLDKVFQMQDVSAALGRDIQQLLTTRPTMATFREVFRLRFIAAGYVEKHFDRFTRDLFHQFDATAQMVLADEAGLKHFVYAGTLIETSRCFCERRQNMIYTVDFAEQWNHIDWRGKIPGGNFLIDRGGYNCRHHISYISPVLADRMSRQRRIEINAYNEAYTCNERVE